MSKRSRMGVHALTALAVLVLAAAVSCGGDDESDASRIPESPGSRPPPSLGSLTISVDPSSIPADGSAVATAWATLTDARGIPQAGVALRFTATLGDVTWITVDPSYPSNLFPTECTAYTGTNGTAQCSFRAGFTPGTALIQVTSADLGLAASLEIGFD